MVTMVPGQGGWFQSTFSLTWRLEHLDYFEALGIWKMEIKKQKFRIVSVLNKDEVFTLQSRIGRQSKS